MSQVSNTVYMVGGSKGGVGKSLVSMALVEYFKSKDESVLLVETDTSNPDVAKCYSEEVDTTAFNLDERNGWIDLSDRLAKAEGSVVIINTGARNTEGIQQHGENLAITLEELKRKLVVLWVMNSHKDSVLLLGEFQKAMPSAQIHVLRNLHFGKPHAFESYNKSEIKTKLEKKGGKTLDFPEVADRVTSEFFTNRVSITKGLKDFTIGTRVELIRWKKEYTKIFDTIAHG